MSSSAWLLPALSALALGAVAWTMAREKRRANGSDTMVGFGAMPPPAPVPEPPPLPGDGGSKPGDLQSLLASAVDVNIPAAEVTAGETVGYTDDEVRTIVSNVLERTNSRDRDWDLRLVAIDSVRKTVDPYKVLLYEVTFLVYIPVQNVGVKLAAAVVVPPANKMYVKSLRTFDPPKLPEHDHPRGSFGVHSETVHAQWAPVI